MTQPSRGRRRGVTRGPVHTSKQFLAMSVSWLKPPVHYDDQNRHGEELQYERQYRNARDRVVVDDSEKRASDEPRGSEHRLKQAEAGAAKTAWRHRSNDRAHYGFLRPHSDAPAYDPEANYDRSAEKRQWRRKGRDDDGRNHHFNAGTIE
jgi:hypothetical protein